MRLALIGAGPWAVLWRVHLPRFVPAALAGSMVVGLYVLGDFGVVSLMPMFLISGFRLQVLIPALEPYLPTFVKQGMGLKFMFGGTSLLIVVGVAMDTVQQIESQLIMRHYEGFMKNTRMRGRRG